MITIDGLSATGKTTVARKVALALGWDFFDSGALYRAVTYWLLQKKIILEEENIAPLIKDFTVDIRSEGNVPRYFIGEEEVTEKIRSREVNDKVSLVASFASVRNALLYFQRTFAKRKKVVFEGRDMGSTVFPQAKYKFFLVARDDVRTQRRFLEVQAKHPEYTREKIHQNLLARDLQDRERKHSPLRKPEDAILVDTSDLSLAEVVEKILSYLPEGF